VTVKPNPNALSITDVRGSIGGTATLPVTMRNEEKFTAFQFEVALPDGVSVSDCSLSSRKGSDHSVSFSKLSNGNYQVAALSLSSKAFSGTDGVLANLKLCIGDGVAKGTYDVSIQNIELTTTDGVAFNPANVSAKLVVTDLLIGDTNGDGKVTITDAVAIVNYILGHASTNFVLAAADVNGDEKVTITDAVAIVNFILKEGAASAPVRTFTLETLDPQ
jgi:hypothetical protein